MHALNEVEARLLARIDEFPCLTVFFPAQGGMPGRPDVVRLRNALRDARQALAEAGVDGATTEALLAPALALADDPDFWRAPAGGVAILAGGGVFRAFRVGQTMPALVEVGRRFLLRPLLPLLDRPDRHYVLALSRKRVRLLEVLPDAEWRLELADLPESFADAMGRLEYQSDVQAHSASSAALGRPAIYHGHGDNDEEHFDADLAAFFRFVAVAIERGLPAPAAPLVLAAVAEYEAPFRRVLRRVRLLDEIIAGNPDALSNSELAARARELVGREHRIAVERQLERWAELKPVGRAVGSIEAIVAAADQGRVQSLFIASEGERWGSYEPDLGHLEVHDEREPGDEDLLDRAASRTLATGGEVHVVAYPEMPAGQVAVAELRFA